ncbi:T9SS type A sorting domain-containing protein [Pleomorphovibrio marinus]|uniref:T9SS type A sorting domain-containing protein n=1 Tax=Pleomorphovibrio marinus TaxID=2164132 RepID=UPI000E0C86C3|nr:T9SS type A sorting domain-containing protein [Pleomorphovibrio marinus]
MSWGRPYKGIILLLVLFCVLRNDLLGQQTVARDWNEALLLAIRNDFARPTVHARNLFHLSAAMYDIWAVYSKKGNPYFLGHAHGEYTIPFKGIPSYEDAKIASEVAISFASYRLIRFRFRNSPGWETTYAHIDSLMEVKGFDRTYLDEDYENGNPAAFGNFLASQIIAFGLQDGSNEGGAFQNLEYVPRNPPMLLSEPGVAELYDPNLWQPLTFETFIDQSGNQIPAGTPPFLGAEWGKLLAFSLKETDVSKHEVKGRECWVYHDPGPPAMLHPDDHEDNEAYIWNFEFVVNWSAHLDHEDGVMWDISPGAMGNVEEEEFPENLEDYKRFFDKLNGGDIGKGYSLNPFTGEPYQPQVVPRGDYTRVLAEFWADGPDSETPPGHWFSIFNYVSDHPLFERKFEGKGEVLDRMEWEVKGYFTLGGAMHDAAITAWSIKGYYDYVRPITAARYMGKMGQSSSDTLPNFHPHGMKLEKGFIELVGTEDPLAGEQAEHVGKIKVRSWRGHDFIRTTEDIGGVDWILAENWWPYQRPTFVTPPFAGYISGHSTFSRAAARVMTMLTGDDYFPGGLAEFHAKENEFLVFEKGPSTDVVLEWARYVDASDQCSLSRIWGGIHPPIDDIPGRIIGEKVGKTAFEHAKAYFEDVILAAPSSREKIKVEIFPNPISAGESLRIKLPPSTSGYQIGLHSTNGNLIKVLEFPTATGNELIVESLGLKPGVYLVIAKSHHQQLVEKLLVR